jgi:hypothetical protein
VRTTPSQTKGSGFIAGTLAQRNRAFVAAVLIGIMVVMWVRVFKHKNGVEAASAAALAGACTADANEAGPRVKIVRMAVPQIKGRTDALTRDVFSLNEWEVLHMSEVGIDRRGEVASEPGEQANETIVAVGKELKLEAISSGKNPQAFINGSLVCAGEKLTIRKGRQRYDFDVVAIGESTATLACHGVKVTLLMSKPVDPAD